MTIESKVVDGSATYIISWTTVYAKAVPTQRWGLAAIGCGNNSVHSSALKVPTLTSPQSANVILSHHSFSLSPSCMALYNDRGSFLFFSFLTLETILFTLTFAHKTGRDSIVLGATRRVGHSTTVLNHTRLLELGDKSQSTARQTDFVGKNVWQSP